VEDTIEKYYEANTAMSVIVPAWRLLALMNRDDVMRLRTKKEEEIMSKQPKQTEEESSS
jgi:hypothetical protein